MRSCCRSVCGPLRANRARAAAPASSRDCFENVLRIETRRARRLQFEPVESANRIMTTTMFSYRLSALIVATLLALTGSAVVAHAQTVVVMVNGEPITNYDIEQRTKLNFLTTHKQAARQEIINELIDEKVKIKEAKKFGVDPTSSDVEQSYTAMSQRMRITTDQLT